MIKFIILFFSLNCSANTEQIAISKTAEAIYIQSGIQSNLNSFIKKQEESIHPDYRQLFGNSIWLLDTVIKQKVEIKVRF
jgi:hypothetical protein